MFRRLLPALLLVLAACGGTAMEESAAPPANAQPVPATTTPTTPTVIEGSSTQDVGDDQTSELAERTRPLGSALGLPSTDAVPEPVGLIIESLGITSAPIVDVGVEPNGEMEIPGATEIGWYRFGPAPGESGSSVLAAHIAFNGRDGVFRNLDDIEVGAIVEVRYEDGTSRPFRVTETAQYPKDELPVNRIFAKDGTPELTLITCGGDFNRSLRSYSDNVVAYAEPIDG